MSLFISITERERGEGQKGVRELEFGNCVFVCEAISYVSFDPKIVKKMKNLNGLEWLSNRRGNNELIKKKLDY